MKSTDSKLKTTILWLKKKQNYNNITFGVKTDVMYGEIIPGIFKVN
jgi:hypothetical protein